MRVAFGVLLLLTVVITWPIAKQLTTSLPGDLGDPLFVTWVMAWVAGQLTNALTDPASLQHFWSANIFYPEPDALAFSEHFIGQTLMVLPLYWLTGNPLLGYNIAFLATFVLSGLGAFAFTRALTASALAASVAAFVVAFNEYRLTYEISHLHVLSIHWFPFALLALHRYFDTDRRRWLIAAAAALIALNLSSVYYMAYCAPFVLVFAILGAVRSGRWRQPRVWLELWATAAAVALVTLPFLLPYLEVQQRLAIVRAPDEVARYSATLDHYRIALPGLIVPIVLAVVGLIGWRLGAVWAFAFLIVSFWLSLGPTVQSGGQALNVPGLYGFFYDYVPGFSGLRVPARFAMLFLFFLGVLAAYGVAAIERRWKTAARVMVGVAFLLLLRTTPIGVTTNQPLPPSELLALPPAYLTPTKQMPSIYMAVDSLRPSAVVAEFPFGETSYEIRYMYFSAIHRRRLMNGYSGVFPPSYVARKDVLTRPLLDPPRAAAALNGATHVVVHRNAYKDNTGALIGGWLESMGALPIAEADGAVLYELVVAEQLAERTKN